MTQRTCCVCGYEGPETDFTVTRKVNGVNHYNGRCRPCYNAYYREKNKRPEVVEQRRRRDFKKKYGITMEGYQDLLVKQGGACAMCGVMADDHWRWLAVDHNHLTGQVRGLLCDSCNKGIGNLKADEGTDLLKKAIAYVESVK